MPRFKRKNRYYKRNKKSNDENGEASNTTTSSSGFSASEKAVLLKYLIEYRNGCERVCSPVCHSDEETVVTSPGRQSKKYLEIAGSRFPALTDTVLASPYLALPKTLSSKQRRRVHEMCVDGKKIQANRVKRVFGGDISRCFTSFVLKLTCFIVE